MADILIKGLALPKKGEYAYNLQINSNGIVEGFQQKGVMIDRMKATAIELPSHGRLKDESVIIENMGNAFEKLFPLDGKHKQTIVSDCHVEFMRAVFKAPTIIDATPVDKLPKEWYDPSEDGLYDEVEASK